MAILLGTIVGGLAAKEGNHPAYFGAMIMVFALLCWGASLLIPRTGQGAPNLYVDPNIARSTGSLLQGPVDRQAAVVGLPRHQLVLAGRRRRALADAAAGEERARRTEEVVTAYLAVFSIAIAIGSLLAAWLAHGRIVLFPTLVGAFLLGVFALDLGFATYGAPQAATGERRRGVHLLARHPYRDRSRGARDRGRPVHRAGVLGGAVLGRRRQARARDRGRQRAQCGVHRRRHAAWSRRCRRRGVTLPQLFLLIGVAQPRRAGLDRPHHAGERPARFPHHHAARDVPHGGEGRGELRQGRPEPDHRAQPCELPRRRGRALADGQGAGVRDRLQHRAALVGEAVPQADARDAARSVQADGDAHADQRREGGRAAGDLPRRAHHRHRQPDEGLRRRRPDRRQVRRDGGAGAASTGSRRRRSRGCRAARCTAAGSRR